MINGLSNFLFFNDSKNESESEKIMNLLFLDSEMRLRAILIVQASELNIELLFGKCFLNIPPFIYHSTSYYFLQFRSVQEDVQVFRISLLNFF